MLKLAEGHSAFLLYKLLTYFFNKKCDNSQTTEDMKSTSDDAYVPVMTLFSKKTTLKIDF